MPDIEWYTANPQANSFTISNANELAGLASIVNGKNNSPDKGFDFSGKTITLTADIDLSSYSGGTGWVPIGTHTTWTVSWGTGGTGGVHDDEFKGTFDGNNKVIRGLTINNNSSLGNQGLFGRINGAILKNIILENVNVKGGSYVGGIAGRVENKSSIINSSSSGEVSGGSVDSCAALNPEVISDYQPQTFSGRVAGLIDNSAILFINIAFNAMTGGAAWNNKGLYLKDGGDYTSAEINSNGTISGFFTAADGWTSQNGKLPGFGGTVAMPEHLGGAPAIYTVKYDINGGSGTTPSAVSQTNAGSSITLAGINGFSREGFVFDGWNTNPSGTGTDYSAGDPFTPAGNITLFAKWIRRGSEAAPFPLTENVWSRGGISGALYYDGIWLSFNAVSGTTYYIWWEDAWLAAAAYYSNGTLIFDENYLGGSTDPKSFTATATGTVKIKVSSRPTYAVVYRTNNIKPVTAEAPTISKQPAGNAPGNITILT